MLVSHIGVNIVSESLPRRIKGWVVLEEESGSEHNYIQFTVAEQTMVAVLKNAGRWAINKLDPERLEAVILTSEWDKDLIPIRISAKVAAKKVTHTATATCDATMPQQHPQRKAGDTYWWMEEIAQLKLRANQLCQQYEYMQGRKGARLKAN